MRWQGRARSRNVQDRRGMGRGAVGGGIGLLLVVVLSLMFGVNPAELLQTGSEAPPAGAGVNDEGREFVEVVLADIEATWHELFRQAGEVYEEPTLVLFDGAVQSACGMAGSAVGPFYCPADRQVYLDLSFFRELARSLGAPGDFAQAYVIAHEIGHHVQTLTGTSQRVAQARARLSEVEGNALSVRVELQADCYAGVWGHHAQLDSNFLEPGDIEEALGAAAAIGDDRLQRRSQGQVVPESFTHGTSEERVRWFRIGLEAGTPEACDTFSQM
jgi:predicted metalloprotease